MEEAVAHIAPPNSRQAEESVIAKCMADPSQIPKVKVKGLTSGDFYHSPMRVLWEQIEENFAADEQTDALTIGEAAQTKLAKLLRCPGPEAVEKVTRLAASRGLDPMDAEGHAELVMRHSRYRELLDLSRAIQTAVVEESGTPQEVAGGVAQRAMKLATSGLLTNDIKSYGELGRDFIRGLKVAKEAHDLGVEMGVFFDMPFIDHRTSGLRGSELMFIAGEPGVGKSALTWRASQNFAERQVLKPPNQQIGTFVLSLEMAEEPSSGRLASLITGVNGSKLRTGDISNAEIQGITNEWAARQSLPYYFNFTSTLRASQLRALVMEAIRRHNVGLVIIDHFRYFDMDVRNRDQNVEDEEKARFLKESVAKDLNVAVICIAHTTKSIETEDKRPDLRHLRGSGQVAAHADFVAFMHRPGMHQTGGDAKDTDAELIFRKNRHGEEGISRFYFDPSRMEIRSR